MYDRFFVISLKIDVSCAPLSVQVPSMRRRMSSVESLARALSPFCIGCKYGVKDKNKLLDLRLSQRMLPLRSLYFLSVINYI